MKNKNPFFGIFGITNSFGVEQVYVNGDLVHGFK